MAPAIFMKSKLQPFLAVNFAQSEITEISRHARGMTHLEIDLEDMGDMAVQSRKAATISSLCTVFAETEVVSLIAEDTPVEVICKSVCRSIAKRTVSMLDRVGREPKLAMSGGVAFNQGVVRELESLTGCRLFIPENPQIMGALGAALFAAESGGSQLS